MPTQYAFFQRNASRILLIALMLFGLFLRLSLISQPIRYDEAYTYLHYARFTPQVFLVDYSYPNNHLFHTVLVHAVTALAGNSPEAIRIPALFFGLLVVLTLYFLIQEIAGEGPALIAAALAAGSSYLIEYSVNARGYTLVTAASVFALYCALRALRSPSYIWWGFMIASIALGAWTLPTMVHPGSAIILYVLIALLRRKPARWPLTIAVILVAVPLASLLLYLPLLIHGGYNNLLHNGFVAALPWKQFVHDGTTEFFVLLHRLHRDWQTPVALACTIAALYASVRHTKKVFPLLIIITLPFFLLLLSRTLPPTRVFLFVLPFYYGIAGIGLAYILEKITVLKKIWITPRSGALIFLIANGIAVSNSTAIAHSEETGYFPDAGPAMDLISREFTFGDRTISMSGDACYDYYGLRDRLLDGKHFVTGRLFLIEDIPETPAQNAAIEDTLVHSSLFSQHTSSTEFAELPHTKILIVYSKQNSRR